MRNDAGAAPPAVRREQSAHGRAPRRELGICPNCGGRTHADARALRYRDDWYHLRCALEHRADSGGRPRIERTRA